AQPLLRCYELAGVAPTSASEMATFIPANKWGKAPGTQILSRIWIAELRMVFIRSRVPLVRPAGQTRLAKINGICIRSLRPWTGQQHIETAGISQPGLKLAPAKGRIGPAQHDAPQHPPKQTRRDRVGKAGFAAHSGRAAL